jgi:hypothetical protein
MWPPLWQDHLLERIGPVADFAAGITGMWRDWCTWMRLRRIGSSGRWAAGSSPFLPRAPPPATSC